MFAYVWEYVVDTNHADAFISVYGSGGKWIELFARDDGYLRTELLRDASDPNRFMTIDYWVSRDARDRFRRTFASEFDALDEACEALTLQERFVGDFNLQPPGGRS